MAKKNDNWEVFVEGTLRNFLEEHDLQSVVVDDGFRKGSLKKNSKGEVIMTCSVKKSI